MFDLLPEECLFIIIQHILDDRSHFEDAQAVGNQNLQKGWKTVYKHLPNMKVPFNMKKHGHKIFGLNNTFHRHPDSKRVGLFMTKTQIEAVGGAITLDSKVNKGTTFKIILKKNREEK